MIYTRRLNHAEWLRLGNTAKPEFWDLKSSVIYHSTRFWSDR